MSDFFWSSGHLGWGVFVLALFTGLWFLLFDMVWRLKSMRITRLATVMSVGWVVGAGLLLLGFFVAK
jgi:hypothetical protein